MPLEWILLAIGTLGFGLAGYLDLKTTEFPDWLPYSIIVAALGTRGVFAFLWNDFSLLLNSIIIGVAFLGFGLLLYYAKQWGDGDAWLLGALGFLFPDSAGFLSAQSIPFPFLILMNFFFISFFYLIVYSLALGLSKKETSSLFFKELKAGAKSLILILGVFTAVVIGVIYYVQLTQGISVGVLYLFPPLLAMLVLFMRYGRFIEENFFKRKIPASQLRLGDVPIGNKWKVMTEKELKILQHKGGDVWVKEGIRLAPVFVITVFVTLFYGNLLNLLFVV